MKIKCKQCGSDPKRDYQRIEYNGEKRTALQLSCCDQKTGYHIYGAHEIWNKLNKVK